MRMQVIINVRMHLGGRGREGGREVHAYAHQMIFDHSRVGLDARGCLDQPARHNPWVPMHMRVHVWGAGAAVGAAGASERRPVGRRKTARFRRLQLLPR